MLGNLEKMSSFLLNEMNHVQTKLDQIDSKINKIPQMKLANIPSSRKPNIIYGISGSVAAIKAIQLATELNTFANVRIVATKAASHFLANNGSNLPPGIIVHSDAEEWNLWTKKEDPVLHIEVRI